MWLCWLMSVSGIASAAAPAEAWPLVRGDAALTGVAGSEVKPPLKLAWSFKAGKPLLATPAVADGRVFIGDGAGELHALSLSDGASLWKFVLMDEKRNRPSKDPVEGSACVLGDRVFFAATDGVIRAFEAASGKALWTYDTRGEIRGGLTPFSSSGKGDSDAILSVGYGGLVVAVSAHTGEKLWEYEAGGPVNGAASVSPLGLVFGGCNGTLDVLNWDGALKRRVEIKIYMPNSAAVKGSLCYFGHAGNKVECYDLTTGTARWEFYDRDFPYFSSPALTGDTLFIGGDDKRLHALRLSDGEEEWNFRTQGKVTSSPVVSGNTVYFGSEDGRFYAVDTTTGKEVWRYEIGAPVKASPAVVGGRVLVGADDGVLYCFEAAAP